MDADSDAEIQNRSNESRRNVNNPSNEGQQSKPKRQMKTPFQLETLEKAYALETYPSEATRAELSEKLGLSDRQLQMWFCHRRLKDKKEKENPPKKMRKNVPVVMPESPIDELRTGAEPGSDYGSGSGSGSSPYMMELRNAVGTSQVLMDDMPIVRRSYESQQSIMELRAIACVEAQLGEPLREDGPILGMEFDSLPPDAFGAPIGSTEQQKRSGHPYESKIYDRHDTKSNKVIARALHEYQSLPEQPYFHGSPVDGPRARTSFHGNEQASRVHGVQGHVSRVRGLSQQDKPGLFSSPNGGEDSLPQRESASTNRINSQSTGHPIFGTEDPYLLSDGQTFNNDTELRMDRKRKSEEARLAREAEANEIRMRKELEKQDNLRRKNEERMRKEMEKHERERRKEEERLMRERQREEERSLREQKREMERREKFLQKEYLRAEKRRLKEELRMEKQAAKRKVAIEKATARKMAKESMDLIEDEQLELMDLAAASKGLSSIIHLDLDTLQNLDSFRDSLCIFPPKSVKLKRPFAVQPWIDSEENIGNLLMVWRFFITFADVLGLWPFTLDEFVQAFHDYESRLLGEIHVALLKSIIKDIEDVARTPSTGLGMNQYCVANPEGGHPRIIEGAYAWGFDIRNWQRHLNALTWPEIFRQLAFAAGFGPKLKKRGGTWATLGDKHEGKGCEDAVSTIRNGSAAENAFAWMREKGLLLPRRSRHKLTPGTVKFAAFHVLSLEGSKGLTVLELADKIQKSGLRDLTTSKTPEASISVALTRDTKLFERIAPSTYCVRPAFRKDPADAEAILAAARKKIRIFENGFLGGEDADDVERDEDSECEVDEDPEVEDLATPSGPNKNVDRYDETNTCSVSGKDSVCNDVALSGQNDVDKGFSSFSLNGSKDANCQSTTENYVAGEDFGTSNLNQENVEIDESKPGESWIQGLTEGDYAHLSVEERLNALVALIGVANEGNSIRAVLEDRLEAANALKKQMWAEAQLDKSRLKEENVSRLDFTSAMGSKAETHLASSAVEGSQSPLPATGDSKNEASPSLAEDQKPMFGSQAVQNHINDFPTERSLAIQDPSTGLDNLATQQHGYASKRSRSQLKAYIGHMAEEMYVYRSLPLGQDRRRNRYWQFATSASRNDPCSGSIFVELHDGTWRLIDTEEAFDTLLSSLDTRGIRESHLRIMLQKIETSFKEIVRGSLEHTNAVGQSGTIVKNEDAEMDVDPDFASSDSPSSAVCGLNSDTLETSSSFRIELGRNEIEKKAALERYRDFQRWMWKECLNSLSLCALKNEKTRWTQLLAICDVCLDFHLSEDSHCPSCHQTFGAVDKSFKFSEHVIQCEEKRKLGIRDTHVFYSSLPLGIRLLKALSAIIEASVPPEAWEAFWIEEHRKTWGMKLNESSLPEEILQILTILESGIKRQYFSSNFETTKELLGSSVMSGDPWSVPILPWIPKTTAAVALRLLELDASIMYVKPEKAETFEDKEVHESVMPSRYLPLKNKEVDLKELDQDGHMKEDNYSNLAGKRKSYKRGKGSRDQGWSRKYQRRTPSITADAGRRNARENENLNQQPKQQGLRTNGRGRRTVRKRAEKRKNETFRSQIADMVIPKSSSRELHRNLDEEEEWGDEKVRMINMDDAENSNSAEAVDSGDNAQAAEEYDEQGNWEVGFNSAPNGWNRDMMDVSDEDEDASGDEPGMDEVAEDDSEGNIEMSEASDQNGIDDVIDSEYSD
ncbi:Homeobox domain-containing protein/DDT domain-containing protein [Melia azedarach]|uniref:Homeobox domain-containing protein/DDT domain-containing protein n=1 Tax=Melia azedarach TaxID=155640 RepID=A0ACC1WWD4_MELAZ|nr:Homeobox domain-containing protein/DDT domain-containing protein [Melia azedarach]